MKKHEKKFVLFSIASLLWLHRSLFKPSRFDYPCQRFARTQSFLFFSLYGIPISTRIKNKSLNIMHYIKSKKLVKDAFIVFAILLILLSISTVYDIVRLKILEEGFRKKYPSGSIARAQSPPRVIRVNNSDVTNWTFSGGYYWQFVDQAIVDQMVDQGIMTFTGETTPEAAWQSIIDYTPGQNVSIQINGNDFVVGGAPLSNINTLPHIACAIVNGLTSIGVPESNIRIIEPTGPSIAYRNFPTYWTNHVNDHCPGVSVLTGAAAGYNTAITGTASGTLYLSDLYLDTDHLIIIPIMKAITPDWGVTGAIKMMQGAISAPMSTHNELDITSPTNPNVMTYMNTNIKDKVRLLVGDGIYGTWTGIHFGGGYGGSDSGVSITDRPQPWITFDDTAPKLLFFATDPVALDSIMYDHIVRERNAQDAAGASMAPFNEPQLEAGEAAGLGEWETHKNPDDPSSYTSIDYVIVGLGGGTTTSSTTTTTTTLPPSGGCPTLFIHDGKDYVKERKSRIHSEEGVDVIDEIILKTKPVAEDGVYTLSLKETTLPEHSYIDAVKLFVDGGEVELISAWHSEYGDVTAILKYSDDFRTETKLFDDIELKFLAPVNEPESSLFSIEGYNRMWHGPPLLMIKLDVYQLMPIVIIAVVVIIVVIFSLMEFKTKNK